MSTWLQRWRDRTFEREVAGVVLAPATQPEASPVLTVGGTLQLAARMADDSGYHPMIYHTAPTFAYVSGDAAKATVGASTGLVTCVATGATDVTVDISVTATTHDGQIFTDSLTVTIDGDTPASVDVSPATATKAVAQTQQLTTLVKNASGTTIAGLTPTYTTSDATKATVSVSGLITAVATGSATITATYAGFSDTCVFTVS